MSTFYIYPIESTHPLPQQIINKNSCFIESANDNEIVTSPTSLTALSPNSLSRILEIPINLFDSGEMPLPIIKSQILFEQQQQQPQKFWLSNNPPAPINNTQQDHASTTNIHNASIAMSTSPTTAAGDFVESCTVTHSFANRKRSIVKRRKSVLSSSFTADEEDEKKHIQSDREATLAVLESGQSSSTSSTSKRKQEEKKGSKEISKDSENQTTLDEYHFLKNQNTKNAILTFSRGFSNNTTIKNKTSKGEQDVEKSEFEQNIPVYKDDIVIDNQIIDLIPQSKANETTLIIGPKDSAIDLRTTSLQQVEDEVEEQQTVTNVAIEDDSVIPVTKVIDLSSSSVLVPPTVTTPQTPSAEDTPSTTPMITAKKKASPWSPRNIFSSTETTKLSKKSSISSVHEKENVKKQESTKFNVSSFFSRKRKPLNQKLDDTITSKENQNDIIAETIPVATPLKTQPNTTFNYTRLPIHTERAIYRLSHLKLANSRRPLRDQVIISNLMFWYLSIVNQSNDHPEAALLDANKLAITKKACRAQIKQQRGSHKRKLRNLNQVSPENTTTGNAMDILNQQLKISHKQVQFDLHNNITNQNRTARRSTNPKSRFSKGRYSRTTNNSSSEDEDSEEDTEGATLFGDSSDDDEINNNSGFHFGKNSRKTTTTVITTLSTTNTNKKAQKKYSIFRKKNKDSPSSWLTSLSSPKQQNNLNPIIKDDEDDIPLAMYQRNNK